MRLLLDYDAGRGLLPRCIDLDTGLPAPDCRWSISWSIGGAVQVQPPELAELWGRRNGREWLIYNKVLAIAFQERQRQREYERLREDALNWRW